MKFRMYDNDTVKFKHDGEQFCLHVQSDDNPMDPRSDWDNPGTHMACWNRWHNLGDKIEDSNPEELWRRLVRENVSDEEILAAVVAGKLIGIRIEECKGKTGLVNIYEFSQWRTVLGNSEPEESLVFEEIAKDSVAAYLIDDLTIQHCMTLMEPYAVWLDLYLYDHSGITMSYSQGGNPFSCPWDSGQVGYIYTTKDEAIKEIGYGEDDWRDRAIKLMKVEVETYDQYLTGNVYGFTLLKRVDGVDEDSEDAWEEIDSCWGFFGFDVLENGICDCVPGLREAIESGNYETGEAECVVHTSWKY